MAEQREIVITIKNETGGSVREESQQVAQGQEVNSDIAREMAGISIVANKMFDNAIQMTKNVLWYKYERNLALNDDYIGQRNLSVARQQVAIVTDFISTVAGYTATGAMGGPVGAIIGAVAGVAVATGNLVFNHAREIDQQNITIKQMDAQLSFNRQRAGFSLTSGSIGENL